LLKRSISASSLIESPTNSNLDAICRVDDRLVLPDANHEPTVPCQTGIVPSIASDVRRELRRPVVGVLLRGFVVKWAHMPEASINEHCDATTREADVDADTRSRHSHQMVFPEAKSSPVER
jgi:hypothetical protein